MNTALTSLSSQNATNQYKLDQERCLYIFNQYYKREEN